MPACGGPHADCASVCVRSLNIADGEGARGPLSRWGTLEKEESNEEDRAWARPLAAATELCGLMWYELSSEPRFEEVERTGSTQRSSTGHGKGSRARATGLRRPEPRGGCLFSADAPYALSVPGIALDARRAIAPYAMSADSGAHVAVGGGAAGKAGGAAIIVSTVAIVGTAAAINGSTDSKDGGRPAPLRLRSCGVLGKALVLAAGAYSTSVPDIA
eukprot:3285965-Rhodomonas_salina.1